MTTIVPQCFYCKHFHKSKRGVFACKAYPDGIPDDILFNEVDHRKPVEGDRGIQFQSVGGKKSPFEP